MNIISSPEPDLNIPQKNIFSYLFADENSITDDIIWQCGEKPELTLSVKGAFETSKRLALGLQKMGLKPGDVVLICTPNHIYVPVAYLGTVSATFIFSGANPAYTAPGMPHPKLDISNYRLTNFLAEIAHQLDNTGAKIILAHPSKLDAVLAAAAKLNFPKDRIFQFSDTPTNASSSGILDWTTILASQADAASWRWPELSPQQAKTTVATVNYSSGTTGLPKGVRISHASLIANVEQSDHANFVGREHERGRAGESSVAFLPLYHAYGQLYTILIATLRRTRVHVLTHFNLETYLSLIQSTRPRQLQLVPPILVLLAKRPEVAKYDLSSVETALSGAAPLSRELQNEVRTRFGFNVKQGWGMTELTCGGITIPGNRVDETGSIGQLLPNTQARLLDEDGKDVKNGEPGELYVRGPQACLGYWRNEKASRELLDDQGWLRTGDVAVYKPETHQFWIVDRKKELIKVNGLQVAPAELEAALLENDHVADAAVVGVTV